MFHFSWPWLFILLPLPYLMRWVLPVSDDRQSASLFVPFYQRLRHQHQPFFSMPHRQLLLATLTWVLLVCAIAQPVWLGVPVPIAREGRDIFLAIDISGSMSQEDLSRHHSGKTRLDVVKEVASQFIMDRKGDRVGLILFGTRAYTQAPLTFDRDTVVALLNDASIGLAGQQTAIGDGVGLAIKRLIKKPNESRVLVLLTDGESNAGHVTALDAAQLAAKKNIKIYTIGIGRRFQESDDLFGLPMAAMHRGDLDEATLKEIASLTGGLYFHADNETTLSAVYKKLNVLEPAKKDQSYFQPLHPLYVWPLSFAFLLMLYCLYLNYMKRGRAI